MLKTWTFEEWMARLDKCLAARCGLTHRDIADFAYRDEFEAGTTPAEAARMALEADGWEAEE